jgi:hypothetical protein
MIWDTKLVLWSWLAGFFPSVPSDEVSPAQVNSPQVLFHMAQKHDMVRRRVNGESREERQSSRLGAAQGAARVVIAGHWTGGKERRGSWEKESAEHNRCDRTKIKQRLPDCWSSKQIWSSLGVLWTHLSVSHCQD